MPSPAFITPLHLPTTPLHHPIHASPRLLPTANHPSTGPTPPPPTPPTPPNKNQNSQNKNFHLQYALSLPSTPNPLSPPILLIHGFGANCLHFRHNLHPLSNTGSPVFAPDLLGFGLGDKPAPGTLDSDGTPVTYTFAYWAAQLVAFIHQVVLSDLPTRPVVLVANSIGAMVTMQLAVEHPALCAAHVFISPSLRQLNVRKRSWVQDVTAPLLMRILSYRPLAAYFLRSLARPQQLRCVLHAAYGRKDAVDDQLVTMLSRPAGTEGALDVFLAFIMYDDGPIPEDFLPLLCQPSLVIWGEEDRFEPFELGQALRHYSIVNRFVPMPGVGHCAHDEVPEEVNHLIADFVREHLHRAEMP